MTVHDAPMVPRFAIWAAVGVVAGLFLAFVGALGSYDYGLSVRLAFWLPLCLTAGAIAFCLEWALSQTGLRRVQPALRWLVFIPVFASVMTPVVFGVSTLVGSPSLGDAVIFFQNSIILSAAYVGGRLAVARLAGYGMSAKPEPAPEDGPPAPMEPLAETFFARLPKRLREAELRAVSSEGHYVRVHTSSGSDLILLRLKDAVLELTQVDGLQVHRGWWVARTAVQGAERCDGRWTLQLADGLTAPVSRKNVALLRQAGWLEAR